MKPLNKPNAKLKSRYKWKLTRRVYVLRGKYRGRGLMKAFLAEKKWEKEL